MPTNDWTPQQRAVRVYEMLLVGPRRAKEVAGDLGLSLRATYDLFANLGIPIDNKDGWWFLLAEYELIEVYATWRRIQESVMVANADGEEEIPIMLTRRQARAVAGVLQRYLPPMPPTP